MFTRLRRRWTPLLMVATIAGFAAVWLLGCSGESIGEALATAGGYGSSAGSGNGGGSGNTTPSHNHTWSDWVVTTQATCDASGVETRTCTQDNSTETRVIPELTSCVTYNGQKYRTVVIGGKRWMAENLNYVPDSGNSWCYYNDNRYCNQYGRLYDWATAMGISTSYNNSSWWGSDVKHRGICPVGWHLPSRAEWNNLVSAVGSSAGPKLKSTSGWNGSGNGTNDFGFSALPGGVRYSNAGFGNAGAGDYGYWWTATERESLYAYYRYMGYDNDYVYEDYGFKSNGRSVRCLED
jgi:uncharacterized protein (TIGR02145 family)